VAQGRHPRPAHRRALRRHARGGGALRLFAAPGLEHNLEFERQHKAIIDRLGRYPHRNAALGRASTPVELAFLREPGSGF
jgi:uncharacterized protein (DUF924 family)